MSGKTAKLTGTALLSALVVVFDYSLKFSGFKIPFPWLPFLKFDFTGVPIVIALFLYGLGSGVTASLVALMGIMARSGDLIGATMKAVAELSTITGMWLGLRYTERIDSIGALGVGALLRVAAMSLANIVVLPNYYGMPLSVALGLLPMLAVFNSVQGAITMGVGLFLVKAYRKRVPVKKV